MSERRKNAGRRWGRRRSHDGVSRIAGPQIGQTTVEYALILALMFAFTFTPMPFLEHPDTGENMSLFMLMIEVFDIYIDSFHTVIILPIP